MRCMTMPRDTGEAKGRAMESLVGHLLVATPMLRDPNFDRTVVLLVAHENGGALGVVLNRATEVPVHEVLGGWGGVATEPSVVFEGGPVKPEAERRALKASAELGLSALAMASASAWAAACRSGSRERGRRLLLPR